ncbi:MAG: radical SAM protein [Saccharolobus sp.]|uniref:radical SAM/SPASM domain-containing protein n=1 Tax=Saccharolobus sp. TaxID=2100761 RepID=UPI0028CDEE15|nr:radical SAM protein [Saccharolobus sp.]MDT7862745.1 radical SAM protein [Saccharolobus sp.]
MSNDKVLFYIYTTISCNLSCVHCYVPSSPNFVIKNELSTEEFKKIIDFAERRKVREIRLTEGEPLIRKDILDIINYVISKNILVTIETNGLLIDNNFLNSIKDLSKVYVSVSLDGPKEVHEKIRGKDTFERVLRSLYLLKEYKVNRTIITTLVEKKWIYDEKFNEFVKLIQDLSPNLWYVHVWVSPAGRGKLIKTNIYDIYNAIKLLYSLRVRLKLNIVLNVPPAVIPEEFTEHMLNDNLLNLGCRFWRIAGFSSNGNVSICHRFTLFPEMRAGNLRNSSLDDIFNHKLLNIKKMKLKGICGKCLIRDLCNGFCRADAYEYYRDFNAPHPLCQLFYENGLFNKNFILREEDE